MSGNVAARTDAVALARDFKQGAAMPGWNWTGWFVVIMDQHGHKVDEAAINWHHASLLGTVGIMRHRDDLVNLLTTVMLSALTLGMAIVLSFGVSHWATLH